MATLFDTQTPRTRAGIIPRDYQATAHDESFRLWDGGTRGTLTRAFTGAGKTLMGCLMADTWLRRSTEHRVMIISYETQLVHQFAQEVDDYLGIKPGIEMGSLKVNANRIPLITVACRASLLRHKPITEDQQLVLSEEYGISYLGAVTEKAATRYISHLRKGGDVESVMQSVREFNATPEAVGATWSRLHKFDWHYDWLILWDEAHRHAYKLPSVGHIVDWIYQNPNSRMNGGTATPKRADGVSIGHKMFPGVALDYPLFAPGKKRCAIKDGWAVPYREIYLQCKVEFKSIAKVAGDFDEGALEAALTREGVLAELCEGMLAKVGDRRTLIFSPGVEMAKDVARYINSRSEATCPDCGSKKWYSTLLIGDGAACKCGRFISAEHITKSGEQAKQLDGESPPHERKAIYEAHQSGKFQFLSVCNLCREGYNDPDVAAVAIFRPVSKAASSLAEQMKGRGCRPVRSIARKLGELSDAESRRKAIAESEKPDCLIIDLVGVSGLEDCASTVEIYAEGLPDEIKARAEEILLERGLECEADVEEAIEQAQREDSESRERIRLEREEAERRAKEEFERISKAGAEVTYTEHEFGVGGQSNDPNYISPKQVKLIDFLGLKLIDINLAKSHGKHLIAMLFNHVAPDVAARKIGLADEHWELSGPSDKQLWLMRSRHIPTTKAKTKHDASLLIDSKLSTEEFKNKRLADIGKARNGSDLDAVGKDLALVRGVLSQSVFDQIAAAGKSKRESLMKQGNEPDGF